MTLHPQFIQDTSGKTMVLLSEKEYNLLVQQNDKLDSKADDFVLTQDHKDILDQRMDSYKNGAKTHSWNEVKENILKNAK